MTTERDPHVGVRLPRAQLAQVDELAKDHGCSRSEALRLVIHYGLPMARLGTSLNIARFAVALEYAMAACSVIISREHADVLERVEDTVRGRLDEFHRF
ncbi:ribbon-helix-helix protein, CopG family [Sphingomonas lenta]|nr:ribbon-helix-helix protein, CopG family [Sphingomonas lenta]